MPITVWAFESAYGSNRALYKQIEEKAGTRMAISHWKYPAGYRRTAQAASAIPQEYMAERGSDNKRDLRKEGKRTGVSDDAITP